MDIRSQTLHTKGVCEALLEHTGRSGNGHKASARPEVLGLNRRVIHSESLATLLTYGIFDGTEQYFA